MPDLLLAWIVAPTILVVLATGTGLLVESMLGGPRLRWLTAPVGVACLIVVSTVTTLTSVLAPWTVAIMTAVAVAGWVSWVVSIRGRRRAAGPAPRPGRASWWPAAVGLATFAIFAAPVVLSGSTTWAGWIKLDDNASWLAFTDYVLSLGHTIPYPLVSSYDALTWVNFSDSPDWGWFGYPRGAFPLLGAMSGLSGTDAAWVLQPYIACLAGLLAVALSTIAVGLVRRRWYAAVAAVVSACAATLYGYAMWGGVKEVLLALLLTALCAVTSRVLGRTLRPRLLVPAAVVALAIIAVAGLNGAGLVAPVIVVSGFVLWGRRHPRPAVITASAVGGAGLMVAVLAARGLLGDRLRLGVAFPDMGNLSRPLSPWQAVGIWPVGDFRLAPVLPFVAYLLVAITAAAAVVGVVHAVARRQWGLPMLTGTSVLLVLYGQYTGDAWLAGKLIAAASPTVLLAAFVGGAALPSLVRRVTPRSRPARSLGAVAAALVVVGVAWSDALAYNQVWLAPHDRMSELEQIGTVFAGQGPALLPASDVFGSRHFLRTLDAEGASDLRVHPLTLRDGTSLDKGYSADLDLFDPATVQAYPLVVSRRSPLTSRPPADYQLAWSGEYYEVWRRNPARASIVADLPLGTYGQPGAVPDCQQVRDLARTGDVDLVAAHRIPVISAAVPSLTDGEVVTVPVTVVDAAPYSLWIAGSFPGTLEVRVDGVEVYRGSSVLEGDPAMVNPIGTVDLAPGSHLVQLRHTTSALAPGSGAGPFPVGPLYLAQEVAGNAELVRVAAGDADQLCGRTLDWVEAVRR
jgi:hypothetical protein